MAMSPEQEQQLRNELWAQATSERLRTAARELSEAWGVRPDRWRLPVPEGEADPADPATHESPLGAISWIFPARVRSMVIPDFWLLLDRMWGVQQADELVTRIVVDDVTYPDETSPRSTPEVTFGQPDLVWGLKLLSMMVEVRDELELRKEPRLGPVDRMISNFQMQVEALDEAIRGERP